MIRVPDYFTRFTCIADKCRDTCCKGWDIYPDEDSLSRYLDPEAPGWLKDSLTDGEDGTVFKRCADGACIHLDERGLCRLYRSLGEGSLCEICREHPRYYVILGDYAEGGLSVCCEAAAELILGGEGLPAILELEDDFIPSDPLPDGWLAQTLERRDALYATLFSPMPFDDAVSLILAKEGAPEKEVLTALWRELLPRLDIPAPGLKDELLKVNAGHMTAKGDDMPPKRLLYYCLHRYYLESAATLDPAERTALAVMLTLAAVGLCSLRGGSLSDSAREISRAVEYCEENRDLILDAVGDALYR